MIKEEYIKERLKKCLPNSVLKLATLLANFIDVAVNYSYDLNRYLKYSGVLRSLDKKVKIESKMQAMAHEIERALSLKKVKPFFGTESGVISSFIDIVQDYLTKFNGDQHYLLISLQALQSYVQYHEANNYVVPKEIKEKIRRIEKLIYERVNSEYNLGTLQYAGVNVLKREEILTAVKGDFKSFANSRHSIRYFTRDEVRIESILEAVEIASKSPSVCNRQSWRVYIICDPNLMNSLLEIHRGSRGIENINKLLVVTSDLSTFFGIEERNQPYIDAGIFLMSLVYSLHYMNLGSCILNWSVKHKDDKRIRDLLKINESETIIALVAVGHIPELVKVPVSKRRSTNEIIKIR